MTESTVVKITLNVNTNSGNSFFLDKGATCTVGELSTGAIDHWPSGLEDTLLSVQFPFYYDD